MIKRDNLRQNKLNKFSMVSKLSNYLAAYNHYVQIWNANTSDYIKHLMLWFNFNKFT